MYILRLRYGCDTGGRGVGGSMVVRLCWLRCSSGFRMGCKGHGAEMSESWGPCLRGIERGTGKRVRVRRVGGGALGAWGY